MSSRVFVALRVAAPQARCFEVFCDQIGDWWQPNELFRTGPGAAGRLSLEGRLHGRLLETNSAGEPFEIGRVLNWQPPERLVLSWRQPDFPDDLSTEVEVCFETATDGGTRVSIEHRGFTRVPADNSARHGFPNSALQMRLAEWWQAQLGAMARHCSAVPES